MKALQYKGPREMAVEEVDDPKISDPRDAIIKVTSAAICGSDLHMYEGRTSAKSGMTFGHEIMGTVLETGEGVHSIKKGDRVVMPFNIACGYCFNCERGYTSACLVTNPAHAGAAFGYADMGPYRGGQAEMVLVPFADENCIKVPGKAGDKDEDNFLMLADIFPTAHFATELAKVMPGSTVAIYGAGPVGLLSIQSALIRGAAMVFAVDESEVRLAKAKELGAIPINFKNGLPSMQIKTMIAATQLPAALLPQELGLMKLDGVMSGIDAVGYQAKSFKDPTQEDPTAILTDLSEVVNPTGAIGIIGVFMPEDPGAKTPDAQKGIFPLPISAIWNKGVSIGTGQAPVKHNSLLLRDLIISGRANPGTIVSHHISLDEAPEAYRLFDDRGKAEGAEYTKVVINP
jgi:glutathione-independent formaldehyde dehydrogenase